MQAHLSSRLRPWYFIPAGVLIVLALLAFAGPSSPSVAPARADGSLTLRAPAFLSMAQAQAPAGVTAIADEAGMSLYFKATDPIDLNSVRPAFRTVEAQTADYIIGSVPVQDYAESEDAHVYVHRDGWFLAYYVRADPASKVIDWYRYTSTAMPTKLEYVLIRVTDLAGVTFTTGTYYDFRYPNATHMIFVVEDTSNGDTFQVNLPGIYTYYERSWSLRNTGSGVYFNLDENPIASGGTTYGSLTSQQLVPDLIHTVRIGGTGYGALVLVYRVP